MRLTFEKTRLNVSYEVARQRVLDFWARTGGNAGGYRSPMPANWFANVIWPGHHMHAQGAGGAASRILKRMKTEGLARRTTRGDSWGWVVLA